MIPIEIEKEKLKKKKKKLTISQKVKKQIKEQLINIY